jgi:hypothetical protein
MAADHLSGSDADFLVYAQTFSTVLTGAATTYGCTAPQATALAGLVTGFQTALAVAANPTTRSPANITAKRTARAALTANLRMLSRTIRGVATLTDEQLVAIGLKPRATPSPINPPAEPPVLEVVSAIGRTLKLRVRGMGTDRRGKPDKAWSAAVYSFVGTAPPSDSNLWTHQGNTTRTNFDVTFPAATPAGSQVWLVAMWCSPREMFGPPCTPVSAYLAGGYTAAAA